MKSKTFYLRFHDDAECIPHLHAAAELIYAEAGSVLVHAGNASYRLRAGEAVLALPYEIHSIRTPHSSRILVSEFSIDYVPEFADEMRHKTAKARAFRPDADGMRYVLSVAGRKAGSCEREACLYFLCAEFLRRTELTAEEAPKRPGLYRAVAYINEHYGEDLSLAVVAEKSGCSYTHLSKLFKDEFGIGFTEYVNDYRLQKAIGQLLETDAPIAEIAASSGFGCVRSFNRTFIRATGLPPTDFRKQSPKGHYTL